MIICHYFLPLCRITVITYATHFKVLKVTYWCQHRHCKVLLFPYIFFWKNAIFMTTLIQILCSFICHQYLFATVTHFCMIFFSSIQRHEGVGAGYWRTLPLAYQSKKKKEIAMKILGNFPVKHPFCSLLFKYILDACGCGKPLAMRGSCPF